MSLHAWATARMSSLNSPVASGWLRRSSMRYCVSVARLLRERPHHGVPPSSVCRASSIVVVIEQAARPHLGLADRLQVIGGQLAPALLEQPERLPQADPVERVAHAARVGEVRTLATHLEVLAKRGSRSRVEAVVPLGEHLLGDLEELVLRVVREGDVVRDAARHPRVGLEELVHAVLVAGEDDDEVVALVLHDLEQDLDRFLAVVLLVFRAVQVVGLVDEEHAAHRPLQDVLGLGRRMPDVLADKIVARDRDDVPFAAVAEAVQDLGHAHRDRGLAGARVAGEAHVQRRCAAGEAHALANALDEQQRGDLAHAALHRRQADEVAVERVEHLGDAGLFVLAREVDRRRRGFGRRGVVGVGSGRQALVCRLCRCGRA